MDYEKERINGLIVRLQNGDKSAFDEFYKLTSPKAYFIALKTTQNEHDAEDVLQESYYASVLQGEMGADETNRALAQWLNEQTNGLLEGHLSDIEFTPETVLALATTLYYNAKWETDFLEEKYLPLHHIYR